MPLSAGRASTSSLHAPLEELSQARYERQLLNEITRLQTALAEERNIINAEKAQMETEQAQEAERKGNASEKANRLLAMEKAIEQAQEDEQKKFMRKRALADKKQQEREAEASKQRLLEARKKDQQRMLAHQQHEEMLARQAEERAAAEQSKRMQDEAKEQKLRERLAAEREATIERNLRKADEAAAKVQRAAEQRIAMTAAQRAAYAERHAQQEARMEQQRILQEKRIAEIQAAGEQKRQVIEQAQVQQKALEEARRTSILNREAKKNQELEEKAAAEAAAREQMQYERSLQEAASRGRVERTMGELQAQLGTLEEQLEARGGKVDDFVNQRNTQILSGQQLAVKGALERASLGNSMSKMRENVNSATLYLEVPPERRGNVNHPELKALLDRVDPTGEGKMSLPAMRKTLVKLLPAEPEGGRSKRVTAASMSSITSSLENLHMSRYERTIAAFKAIDTDDSGEISKRELYEVLKQAGLANGKQALEVFQGADENDDGKLSFEEFQTIAKAIC